MSSTTVPAQHEERLAGSSFATATRSDFDWEQILDGADWFHFTGITPALGGELPDIVLDACQTAKKKGITVSCDLNYRKKLWSREKAGEVINAAEDLPRSFVLCEEDGERRVWLSSLSSAALSRR